MARLVRRLGDILIEERLITTAQRDEALRHQKMYGGRIGTNLIELGAIELDALARALSRQRGVPAALQKHFDAIHGEAVSLIPAHVAQKNGAIPLGFTSLNPKTVAVAFLDPTKTGALNEIQFAAGARIYPVIAPELRIVLYLEKLYGIPRHVRFLRLEHAKPDAQGRWTAIELPSERTPSFLSAPETPPEGVPIADPRALFDMTRPDLTRPRTSSTILLTEAVPSVTPRPSSSLGSSPARAVPLSTPVATRPSAASSKRPDAVSASSPIHDLLPTQPTPIAPPRAPGTQAGSSKRPNDASSQSMASLVPQPAASAARHSSREATPPPLPLSKIRSSSPSHPVQEPNAAARPTAMRNAPVTSSPVGSHPAVSAGAPAPELEDPNADETDSSSRAPTIPEMPAIILSEDLAKEPPLSTGLMSPTTPQAMGTTAESSPAITGWEANATPAQPAADGRLKTSATPKQRAAGLPERTTSIGSPEVAVQGASTSSASTLRIESSPTSAEPSSAPTIPIDFDPIPAKPSTTPTIPIDVDPISAPPSSALTIPIDFDPISAAASSTPTIPIDFDPISAAPSKTPTIPIDFDPISAAASSAPTIPIEFDPISAAPGSAPTIPIDFDPISAQPSSAPMSPIPLVSPLPEASQSTPDAPSGVDPSSGPAPPASRSWSVVEAVDAIAIATEREEIGDALVNYLRSVCGVGLVLIVQHEVALGWKGFAPALNDEEVSALGLPLAAPSVLQIAHRQRSIFRGPPPSDGVQLDSYLWQLLRSPPPQEAIVAPVLIKDRVVNLIYGHAADGGPLPDRALVGLKTLSRAASAAYVRLIHAAKGKGKS